MVNFTQHSSGTYSGEIIAETRELHKALVAVKPTLPTSHYLPVLTNYFWSIDGDNMEISASNMINVLKSSVSVNNPSGIKFTTLVTREVTELLSKLDDETVSVRFNIAISSGKTEFETRRLIITVEGGHYEFEASKVDSYPSQNHVEKEQFTIPGKDLSGIISSLEYAASNDHNDYVKHTMCIKFGELETHFIACDINRVRKVSLKGLIADSTNQYLINKPALSIMKTICDKVKSEVVLSFGESTVQIALENIVLTARLYDEKYPDALALLKMDGFDTTATLNKDSLKISLGRIGIFNPPGKETHIVFRPENAQITVFDHSKLIFEELRNHGLGFVGTGEIKMSLNTQHLIDCLDSFSSDRIKFHLKQNGTFTLITPGVDFGESSEGEKPEEIGLLTFYGSN